LEQYLKEVRSIIGCEIPLAVDHCGHISVTGCIKLAKQAEKYNITRLEELLYATITGCPGTLKTGPGWGRFRGQRLTSPALNRSA
jgi:hypothetical protein